MDLEVDEGKELKLRELWWVEWEDEGGVGVRSREILVDFGGFWGSCFPIVSPDEGETGNKCLQRVVFGFLDCFK